jgi:nitrogen fixation protein FixH
MADGRPFTGKHMLAIMLGFFAVVLAANMTMVYFAKSSWTGLVVPNSYVASQEFNEKTAALVASESADVHPVLSFEAGTLKLTLRTKGGDAVPANTVKVSLGRPSHEGEDRTVDLVSKGGGLFEAPQQLAGGQWTGTVSADLPGHGAWSRPIRIIVK